MDIQLAFELSGVAFFSISTVLGIADKKLNIDWFGVFVVSFICALGGGTLRDLFLNSHPLVWIGNIYFVYAVIIGTFLAKIFFKIFIKLKREFFLFDTLGLAVFTIVGTEKALMHDVNPIIAIIMGVLTGVMGGVLRDVFIREIPIIFQKEVYATVSIVGATIFVGLYFLEIPRKINLFVSGGVIVIIRLLVVRYNLHFPNYIQEKKQKS